MRVLGDTFRPGAKLLHAGCGAGAADIGVRERFDVTALDSSTEALQQYQALHAPCPTSQSDVRAMPFEAGSFDGVYSLGLLEHFQRDEAVAVLKEMARVTRPDGSIVAFWPHRLAPSAAVLSVAARVFSTSFHPPEPSRIISRDWATRIFTDANLRICHYDFGPSDFFVQAAIVAKAH
jgi:SAM-dependent methyltransferase